MILDEQKEPEKLSVCPFMSAPVALPGKVTGIQQAGKMAIDVTVIQAPCIEDRCKCWDLFLKNCVMRRLANKEPE